MEQWIEKKQSINPRTMRARLLLLIVIALISAATSRPTDAAEQTVVYAQECITNVDNATVHIPADVEPSLPDGAPVEPGDTLAVYTEEGICAGYGVWEEGKGATFAAAGSDSVDVSPDGYSKEEPLKFEVFDVSAGRTAEIASSVTFASCDDLGVPVCAEGTYEEGTFHQVAEFQSDSSTPVTRAITLAEGWNFISVPVQTDLSFEELLPECSSGFLYAPGEGYTAIDSSDPLPAGKGAAVQCEADTTSVSGSVASPTLQVEAGWNLIGSVEDTVDVAAITTSPAGMLESDFFKLPPGEGYEPAMELHPGKGYWVKTAEAGTIDVSGESAPVASTPEKLSREQGSTSQLVFVDASGRQTTLWLEEGMSQEQLSQYELPPVPPGEVFDVRFESGHQAVSLTTNGDWGQSAPEHRVQVQGADFPVEVRLETEGTDQRFDLTTGGQEFTLSSERASASIQRSTDQLAVAPAPNPSEFKLGKASPNPLRGQAKLEYTLPEDAEVSIAVYDVLGRQVERLVDGTRKTGVHQAQVNATNLSSGKYFVRMRAGSFRKTQQLTVVR